MVSVHATSPYVNFVEAKIEEIYITTRPMRSWMLSIRAAIVIERPRANDAGNEPPAPRLPSMANFFREQSVLMRELVAQSQQLSSQNRQLLVEIERMEQIASNGMYLLNFHYSCVFNTCHRMQPIRRAPRLSGYAVEEDARRELH